MRSPRPISTTAPGSFFSEMACVTSGSIRSSFFRSGGCGCADTTGTVSATSAATRSCFMSVIIRGGQLTKRRDRLHAAISRLKEERLPGLAYGIDLGNLPGICRLAGRHEIEERLTVHAWGVGGGRK